MKNDFIEDNIIILSRQTIDLFLRQESPADLIALYTFYYYTAKWQKTNQPKATVAYCARALKWSDPRVQKAKKILTEIGLIEDIRKIDDKTKKVKGWYVKVNYLWKRERLIEAVNDTSHPPLIPGGGNTQGLENLPTNALNAIRENALNAVTLNSQLRSQAPQGGGIGDLPNQGVGGSAPQVGRNTERPFSYVEELEALKNGGKNGNRKEFKIIALYWIRKRRVYENRAQFNEALKRELRPAVALKGYSRREIEEVMDYCDNTFDLWTLETVGKRISDLINTHTPIFN